MVKLMPIVHHSQFKIGGTPERSVSHQPRRLESAWPGTQADKPSRSSHWKKVRSAHNSLAGRLRQDRAVSGCPHLEAAKPLLDVGPLLEDDEVVAFVGGQTTARPPVRWHTLVGPVCDNRADVLLSS